MGELRKSIAKIMSDTPPAHMKTIAQWSKEEGLSEGTVSGMVKKLVNRELWVGAIYRVPLPTSGIVRPVAHYGPKTATESPEA